MCRPSSSRGISEATHSKLVCLHSAQAWRPRREQSSWARIDLLENTLIGGTVTWGNRDANRNYYVTSYCIKYRRDGSQTWIPHSDANGSRVVSTQRKR